MNISGPANDLVALTLQICQLGPFTDGVLDPINLPGTADAGAALPVIVVPGPGANQTPIYPPSINQYGLQSIGIGSLPPNPSLFVEMTSEMNQCINETNRYQNSL